MVERRGKDQSKNMYKGPRTWTTVQGLTMGVRGMGSVEEGKGEKIGTIIIEQ